MTWQFAAIALCALLGAAAPALAEKAAPPAAATEAPSPTAAGNLRLVEAQPAAQAVTLTGFTRARAEMKLISEVAGRCLKVEADVGQVIGADGVFARLDATFTKLELETNLVEQARLKSRLDYLEKDLKRTRTLVAKKSQAQAKLDGEEQEFDQARLQLRGLQIQEKILRERLARHQIKAPRGWLVMERSVEPAQWVGSGAEVGRAGDFRTLLVPLALTTEEYTALRNGGDIVLNLPSVGQKASARVYRVSPAFDPATRKINLDLAIEDGLNHKRGGLRAELVLNLPDPSGAVLVPTSAVKVRYQETWLLRPDGSQVKVVVLGPGPENDTLRVASPEIRPGQKFQLTAP